MLVNIIVNYVEKKYYIEIVYILNIFCNIIYVNWWYVGYYDLIFRLIIWYGRYKYDIVFILILLFYWCWIL